MLRDRAAPLNDPAGKEIVQERASDARDVHATMPVEVGVLGGDERLADHDWNPVERNEVAPFEEELANQLTTQSVHLSSDGGAISGQLIDRRQVLADLAQHEEADDPGYGSAEQECNDQDAQQSGPDRTPRAGGPVASLHLSRGQYARSRKGVNLPRPLTTPRGVTATRLRDRSCNLKTLGPSDLAADTGPREGRSGM